MLERIKSAFDVPSRRVDADYSKDISSECKLGILLLYRDYLASSAGGGRISEVLGVMAHSHPLLACRGDEIFPRVDAFSAIGDYLLQDRTGPSAFLDFLELSLRNWRAPNFDNDFVDAVNRVLVEYDSPYLLTRYVRREEKKKNNYGIDDTYSYIDASPRTYLRQEAVVQKHAIKPALEVFSDPAYATPREDFLTALKRHRTGDYEGCVTSCATAVEGAIRVAGAKNGWRKVKGNGLETLAQSFISKSSLPDTVHAAFRSLDHYRNTAGDAHGHASRSPVPEVLARHFVAEAASLIVLVQSQVR